VQPHQADFSSEDNFPSILVQPSDLSAPGGWYLSYSWLWHNSRRASRWRDQKSGKLLPNDERCKWLSHLYFSIAGWSWTSFPLQKRLAELKAHPWSILWHSLKLLLRSQRSPGQQLINPEPGFVGLCSHQIDPGPWLLFSQFLWRWIMLSSQFFHISRCFLPRIKQERGWTPGKSPRSQGSWKVKEWPCDKLSH